MKKTILKILPIVLVLLCPLGAFGAGKIHFTYAGAVYTDDKGGEIKMPVSVSCNGDTVTVADAGNDRLLQYTYQNGSLQGGSAIKVGQLSSPLVVKITPKGEILALDEKVRRIVRLSAKGEFLGYLDPTDVPPPQEYVIRNFALDEAGNVYILDIFSGRILVLDPTGKFIRQIDFPAQYGFFSDLTVDKKGGDVLAVDTIDAVVDKAGKDDKSLVPLTKSLKEYLNFPVSIATDSKGQIYLVDRNGGGVVMLGPTGSFIGRQLHLGWQQGELYYPTDICVNSQGVAFIADRNENRIQFFTVEEGQ